MGSSSRICCPFSSGTWVKAVDIPNLVQYCSIPFYDPQKTTQTLWIILVHVEVGRHMIFHICIYIIYTHVYYAEYTFPMFELGTLTHPHWVYAFIRLKTNGCRCGAPGWCLSGHVIHTTTFWIHAGYIYHCWLHIPNCWFHITFYPSFFCPHCCNFIRFISPFSGVNPFFKCSNSAENSLDLSGHLQNPRLSDPGRLSSDRRLRKAWNTDFIYQKCQGWDLLSTINSHDLYFKYLKLLKY